MTQFGKYSALLVAFTVLFSTVCPGVVSADDTATISNGVRSSSNTGGLDGIDGEAGSDGHDGHDGQDGQDGRDGHNGTSGTARAGASISNVVSGNNTQTIVETTTSSEESEVQIEQSASATTASHQTAADAVATQATNTARSSASDNDRYSSQLSELIQSLKAAITAYVQSFF